MSDAPDTPPATTPTTPPPRICDIWLIRHARGVDGGAMAGRRDIDADCSNTAGFAALRARLGTIGGDDALHTSPARRCVQTATTLLGFAPQTCDARLWEQNFGAWEGMPFANLPDLGPLGSASLAQFAPPDGESFNDVCARVWPALLGLGAGRHVVVAHAGVIRAALGLALSEGAAANGHLGLGFSVGHLSLTRISRNVMQTGGGDWAILCANVGAV